MNNSCSHVSKGAAFLALLLTLIVPTQGRPGYPSDAPLQRPYLWRGNLFKAVYWAAVGRPAKLAEKVAKAQQQLHDIQARGFANTGAATNLAFVSGPQNMRKLVSTLHS